MAQNLNQFKPSIELGMIALEAIEGRTLQVRIDPSYVGDGVKNGDVVKLVATSEGADILVTPKSSASDAVLGIVAYTFKKTTFKAGDYCEVDVGGKIVYGKIGEAVNAGTELTWDATNGFVAKSTGTVDGIALDKSGVGTGRVIIKGII